MPMSRCADFDARGNSWGAECRELGCDGVGCSRIRRPLWHREWPYDLYSSLLTWFLPNIHLKPLMTSRANKFRQAAVTYVGLGIVVIALTLVAGASAQRRTPPLLGLLIGALFVALFAVVIYSYAWVTKGWARRTIAILTGIFVVTNALRTLQYLINFLGYRLELNFRALTIAIHPSEFSFPFIFLICTLLMACITYMLARAAWDL